MRFIISAYQTVSITSEMQNASFLVCPISSAKFVSAWIPLQSAH